MIAEMSVSTHIAVFGYVLLFGFRLSLFAFFTLLFTSAFVLKPQQMLITWNHSMSFLFVPILTTFSSSVVALLPLALPFHLPSASAALHRMRSTLLPSVLTCSCISLTSSSLSYASVVACVKLRAVG